MQIFLSENDFNFIIKSEIVLTILCFEYTIFNM